MRFVPYEEKDLRIDHKRGNNYKLLMEFHNSDLTCVKVEDYPHKNAHSCQNCLYSTVKRYHLNEIRVVIRGQDVFLVKQKI